MRDSQAYYAERGQREVDYDDRGARQLAFLMTAKLVEVGVVAHDEAERTYFSRLGELRETMSPVLIYTDDNIAAQREYHLKQPWTD